MLLTALTLFVHFTIVYCQSLCGGEKRLIVTSNATIVSEHTDLRIVCSSENSFSNVMWYTESDTQSRYIATALIRDGSCVNSLGQSTKYEFLCIDNSSYAMTIKNVTRDIHGHRILCGSIVNGLVICSNTITIRLQVPITYVQLIHPENGTVTVIEHTSILFTCLAPSGQPTATVRWYKDNKTPDTTDDDIEISGEASTFTNNSDNTFNTTSSISYSVNRRDNGVRIYCTANNTDSPVQISTRQTLIDVQYSPGENPRISEFATGDRYLMIRNSHETQHLTCMMSDGNPLPTLSWICYSGTTSDNTTGRTTYSTLTWVAGETERHCTCVADHPLLTQDRKISIAIELLYPPSMPVFNKGLGIIKVTEGDTLSVQCNSSSNPEPAYKWQLPDGIIHKGPQLTVENMQISNNYIYTCIAENIMVPSVGTITTGSNSSSVFVLLSFSPRPSRDVPLVTNIKANLNTRVALTFTAIAYPVPELSQFVWHRCNESICEVIETGHNLNISTKGLVTTLTVNKIQQTDFGTYILIISNGIGDGYEQEYVIAPKEIPDSSTDSNSALIGGVVGGCLSVVVIIIMIVSVIVIIRRRRLGDAKAPTNESETSAYAELNMTTSPAVVYDPITTNDPVSEITEHTDHVETSTSSYSDITQYGNVQNTYEQLDTATGGGRQRDNTYTNVLA